MQMTFKDREAIIRRYATEYNKSKIIEIRGIDLLKKDGISDSCSNYMESRDKYLYYYSLQLKIDSILEKLDWDASVFMKKEFFCGNYRNDWWINYYSRSTYYRLKKKFMEMFLRLLYD